MSRSAVRGAVTAYLEANWTASPLILQNAETKPPVQADGTLRPWVYVQIAFNSVDQWSIGAADRTDNRWREDGLVLFHIMTPIGEGLAASDTNVDALIELFKGVQLDPGIEFRDITSDTGGYGDDNGNYYRVSVAVDWVRN